MRIFPFALAAFVALLVLPAPLASAAETFNCHRWDVFVGDRSTGAGASTDSAVYVAGAGFYVVSDGVPPFQDFLFSIWFYEETNGEPGLQRGDETCDETNGGETESDGGCFC